MIDLSSIVRRISEWLASPRPQPVAPKLPGTEFHDRRRYATQGHGEGGKWKVRGRTWQDVRGICLHQTACLLGERPERWDTVGAHIGITRGGRVMWLHGFNRVVCHGNGWNAQTVGIEIDGLYAGIQGDDSTVWDDPSTRTQERGMSITPESVLAAREVIRWICSETAAAGGAINVLVAHRQSSKSRRNDPGSAIWQEVALPMHAELGLKDGGYGFEIGGLPIPAAWDKSKTGIPY